MRFFLGGGGGTLAFDLEQDAVHLVDEDHRLQYLGEVCGVEVQMSVEEVAVEVDGAVGGDFGELGLCCEGLGVDELSVALPQRQAKRCSQSSACKVVHK